jgi:hypothetical protein
VDQLNELEAAVLALLLAGDDPTLTCLREQLRRLRVTSRERTGVGFFTNVEVVGGAPRLPGRASLRFGDVDADIDGLASGAGFLLVVDDGLMTMLEGYAYADETWPEPIGRFALKYTSEPRETSPLT